MIDGDGQLPLEAEPEIEQHRDDREHDADGAGLDELARDARSHRFHAAEFIVVAEGIACLLHHGRLRGLAAGLDREAQRDLAGGAEFLHLHVAEAEAFGGLTDLADIGLARLGLDLHERAAPEIDAEIEAAHQEHQPRQHRDDCRQREREAPKAHEVEV